MAPVHSITSVARLQQTMTAPSAPPSFDRTLASGKQPAHVLNRLAYGPRPGDVAEVTRLGVEAWIRRQLRPDRIPESPVLTTKLELLPTLRLATWEIFESYQAPASGMMMAAGGTPLNRLVPADQLRILQTGTADERRQILTNLPLELRKPVLLAAPAKALEGLPDLQAAAFNERAQVQRRLRPLLTDILTDEQLKTLYRGTGAEKTALIASFDSERRAQVLRQAPPAVVPERFRREAIALGQPAMMPLLELIDAKLYRALYSRRQLEELMVDFWLNHFNVFSGKGVVRVLLTSYERDAIRPHVFGRFRDMLLATARHPAMLFYLDNWQSRASRDDDPKAGLNENYGRELMELHTLGVDGGYTQADVVEVARAFTGWTIHEPDRYGEFFFNPAMHDREEKIVLGQTLSRGGGEDDGIRIIDMLAAHPSTARFIARKLAQRFVADEPPQSLIDRVAATFRKTEGDLRATLETLLLSREFLSEGAWQAKMKSPFEMVASALRALDAEVSDTVPVAQRIADLGQPLYGKPEPTGYPNVSAAWASAAGVMGRMNLAAALAAGQVPGVTIKTAPITAANPERALTALLGDWLSPRAVQSLTRAASEGKGESIAAILMASPDFQRR